MRKKGGTAVKFQTVGEPGKPLVIMLPGSFCQSVCLKYLYDKLKDDYRIILPEYNGHYENSTFTTRENEAKEIAEYLQGQNIKNVKMIYGQSMGAEIGLELFKQLQNRVDVEHCFFDGAPCIRLSRIYRKIMYRKFRLMISTVKKRGANRVLKMKFLKKFSNGDPENLRPIIEALSGTAAFLTDESVKNEAECCYTFDFPKFDDCVQEKINFFYANGEKAHRLCFDGVKKAYPAAKYTIIDDCGHLTYSIKKTDDYVRLIRKICEN